MHRAVYTVQYKLYRSGTVTVRAYQQCGVSRVHKHYIYIYILHSSFLKEGVCAARWIRPLLKDDAPKLYLVFAHGLEASNVSHRLVDHRLVDHRQPWPARSAALAEQLGCWLTDHPTSVYISTYQHILENINTLCSYKFRGKNYLESFYLYIVLHFLIFFLIFFNYF